MNLFRVWSGPTGNKKMGRDNQASQRGFGSFPGLGLGVLCISFARHAFGGDANNLRILLLAMGLYFISLIPTFMLVPKLAEITFSVFFVNMIPGVLAGTASMLLSWISWWGRGRGGVRPKIDFKTLPTLQNDDFF